MYAYVLAFQLLDSLNDGVFIFQLTFHGLLEFGCDFRVRLLRKLFLRFRIHPLHGQCDFEFSICAPFLCFAFQIALLNLDSTIPFRA